MFEVLSKRYCLSWSMALPTILLTMRRIPRLLQAATTSLAIAGLLGAGLGATVQADSTNQPSLVISQLKITSSNGQFVTLYNATNATLDMSKYQLEYFNSYDLSKATSSRLVALQGTLPPHSYYQVNDSSLLLCYQVTIDSLSLGFASTAGFVEVLAYSQSNPGSSATPVVQDYVGWSKTAATGAQTLPTSTNAFLQRQPSDTQNNPVISSPGNGSWLPVQPDTANPCKLVTFSTNTTVASTPVQTGLSLLLPTSEPQATLIDLPPEVTTPETTRTLPSTDTGLMAPKITELLPNPNGTGNDASDEFIELYNPNIVAFDLSGFTLQTGLTTTKSYTFPKGTILGAQSFTAFFSENTGLSLSNTASQAKLLGPLSNVISESDSYKAAKDGQSWALANGVWYFTAKPTPGGANVITKPAASKTKKPSLKSTTLKSKTAKTNASNKTLKTTPKKSTTVALHNSAVPKTPIHFQVLALVAGLGVLYGAYEYRTDMANRIYQFRQHLAARRANR